MQPPRRAGRPALTLLETLVVLGIVALLIGLLLPAVQRVRVAAARAAGRNNLRQLALAAHQYEDQHGALPDFATPIDGAPTNLPASGVFTKLLPYVEQQAVYRDVLAHGLPAAAVTVKVYVDPLDGTATAAAGGTSYVANDRVFGAPGRTLAGSFPDGAGQTLLFSERLMRCGSGQSAAFNAWPIVVDLTPVAGHADARPARLALAAPPQFGPTAADCRPGGASSPDPTGILAAMGDGGVRTVSPGAARGPAAGPAGAVMNWQAALTPAGGETLGAEW
jgi:type II secretory pathway pseudopilin PulG